MRIFLIILIILINSLSIDLPVLSSLIVGFAGMFGEWIENSPQLDFSIIRAPLLSKVIFKPHSLYNVRILRIERMLLINNTFSDE